MFSRPVSSCQLANDGRRHPTWQSRRIKVLERTGVPKPRYVADSTEQRLCRKSSGSQSTSSKIMSFTTLPQVLLLCCLPPPSTSSSQLLVPPPDLYASIGSLVTNACILLSCFYCLIPSTFILLLSDLVPTLSDFCQ